MMVDGLNTVRFLFISRSSVFSVGQLERLIVILNCSFQGLDEAQLEHKMRVLTLAALGFQNVGQDLPYSTIAAEIQVDENEVEKWVIDGTSPC